MMHCALTNLIGESAFGDFDSDISKRRNASLHNRSAVHCTCKNQTMKYLESKSTLQVSNMLKVARKRAPFLRKENKKLESKVKDEVRERFVANQRKKIQKEMDDIQKRSELAEKVQKHGGRGGLVVSGMM